MIRDNDTIWANEGKTLYYTIDGIVWGKAARLALYNGHVLTEEDFVEVEDEFVVEVDGEKYFFGGWSYADIKRYIIKLHYSNDDQIALMLNYEESPYEYEEKYLEMQRWRGFASDIAKRLTNK